MKRNAIYVATVCFLVLSFAQVALTQKVPNLAGTWQVTARMPEGIVSEQWTIQQKGATFTGTVKTPRGERQVTGEIVNGVTFRAEFKVGDMPHKVLASIDNDTIDGALSVGATGAKGTKQYIWQAKRSKS